MSLKTKSRQAEKRNRASRFRWAFQWIWIVSGGLLIASGGCNQRTVAPEISYDQSQVDLLKEEIEKLDWE